MIKATYLLKKRLRFKGVHVTLTRRLLFINLYGHWFSGVTKLHQTQVIQERCFETEPTRSFNDKVFIRIQVLAVTYFHGILFSLIKISDFKNKKLS